MILLKILVFIACYNVPCHCLESDICAVEIFSHWGQRSFYKATEDDFFPVEQSVLDLLSHAQRRVEPTSGMVKLMLDFLLRDLLEMEPRVAGYENVATPVLDLSHLKHKSIGKYILKQK